MSTASWVLVGLGVWCALSVPVSLAIARVLGRR